MFLLLCAASGSAWGLLALYIGFDGDDRAGLVAAAVSPGIGIIIGLAARRFAGLQWVGRGLYALVAVYVATALFIMVGDVAHQTLRVANAWTAPLNVFVRALQSVVLAWFWMTFGGLILWLWPLSLANHVIIWNWLSGPAARGPQRLGLTV
jgi:hypothetical protein